MPERHTTEYISEKIIETGDKLVKGHEYINDRVKLDIVCHHCNEIYQVTWNNFRSHSVRCPCQTIIKRKEISFRISRNS